MPAKRVCIVTWFGTGNHGTNLQALALSRYLESVGVEPTLIASVPERVPGFPPSFSFGYYIRLFLLKAGLYRPWLRIKASLRKQRRPVGNLTKKQKQWFADNLNITRIYFPWQLERLLKRTDCFIAGSDQIWNTKLWMHRSAFLDFCRDRKRISYATSIGTEQVNPEYAEEISSLLSNFSRISVREESAATELASLTGRSDIEVCVDPVLLFDAGEWKSLLPECGSAPQVSGRYCLCYLLGNRTEYDGQIERVTRETGIDKLVFVNIEGGFRSSNFPDASFFDSITPDSFLNLIANAAFVCTDSFHGTLFSLIFQIPFVEFTRFDSHDSQSQNSRLTCLLHRYGLEDRFYSDKGRGWTAQLPGDLTANLANDIAKSKRYLKEALGL